MEAGTGLVDDLASLADLNEENLLGELLLRYRREEIYTYVGDILIAVNPFKPLQIYSIQHASAYSNIKVRAKMKPHIFGIADNTYQSLMRNKSSQCVVVSGESGAGKTESTKLMVRHLVYLCSHKLSKAGGDSSKNLHEQLLEVNPLLEAFGNAQTVMNNNSSRFGKYIELLFTKEGTIVGGRLSIFLLEKSRVVGASNRERNFHVFYYMFAGLSADQKKSYFLKSPEHHRLLYSGSGAPIYKDALDVSRSEQLFGDLLKIMKVVGFLQETVDMVFAVLAAVVHICDIRFEHDEDTDGVYVVDEFPLEIVSQLLGISTVDLATVLISNVTEVRGEKIVNLKTTHQANDGRDALAKALYSRLFSWIVHHINETIIPPSEYLVTAEPCIGLLDIAGFENFQHNSFEQLCINVANEQLQHYFNQHIFACEMDDLDKENVHSVHIKFTSNLDILNLILEKPLGLFCLLDEESKFPKATDTTLLDKFKKHLSKSDHFKKAKARDTFFSIIHYAGHVTYDATGFLEKNRDTLSVNIVDCLTNSESQTVHDLFSSRISDSGDLDIQKSGPKRFRRSVMPPRHTQLAAASNGSMASLSRSAGRKLKEQVRAALSQAGQEPLHRHTTAGAQFLTSLAALTKKLTDGEPHFVRCIKPNNDKCPAFFVTALVLQQLRCTGIMETIRIRREGFPTRLPFQTFFDRYRFISFALTKPVLVEAVCCQVILIQAGLSLWAIGKTKVFLKYWHIEQLNAVLDRRVQQVVVVQRHMRGFMARKRVHRLQQIVHARKAAIAKAFLQSVLQKSEAIHLQLVACIKHDAAVTRQKREAEAAALLEQRRVKDEQRQRVEEEQRRKADEERRQRVEEEYRRRAEEEQRRRAEQEQKRRAEEDQRQKAEEDHRQRKADAHRQMAAKEQWRHHLASDSGSHQQHTTGAGGAQAVRKVDALNLASQQQQQLPVASRLAASHPEPTSSLAPKDNGDSPYFLPGSSGKSPLARSIHRESIDSVVNDVRPPAHNDEAHGAMSKSRSIESWLAKNVNQKARVTEIRSHLEAKAVSSQSRVATVAPNVSATATRAVSSSAAGASKLQNTRRALSSSENDISRLHIMAAAAATARAAGGSSRKPPSQAARLPSDRHSASSSSNDLAKTKALHWRSRLAALTGMDTIRELSSDYGEASHYARSPSTLKPLAWQQLADSLILEVEVDMSDCLGDKDCWCRLVYMERHMTCASHLCRDQEVRVDGSHGAADERQHIGLGAVLNPFRDPKVAKLREYIGKGLSLRVDNDGNIWATRLGVNEVTALGYSNPAESCVSVEIVIARGKLPHDIPIKVFDMNEFKSHVILAMRERGLRCLDNAKLKRLCVASLSLIRPPSVSSCMKSGGIPQSALSLHLVNLVALRVLHSDKALKELEQVMFKMAKKNSDFTRISQLPEFAKVSLAYRPASKYKKTRAIRDSVVHEKAYNGSTASDDESEDEPSGVAVNNANKITGHKWIKLTSRNI